MEIADSDVVVGIFWKRFGTPTGDAQSETEHELRKASDAWRQKRPPGRDGLVLSAARVTSDVR